MNYYEFVGAVEGKLQLYTEKEVQVSVFVSMKNNGVERRGLTFAKKGVNVAPTIYLEEYYEEFQRGRTLNEICQRIADLYEQVRLEKSLDTEVLGCYERVRDNLQCRLVNYEHNRERIERYPKIPFRKYLDLAVTVHFTVECGISGIASMQVTEEHLKEWNMTEEQLFSDAWNNTTIKNPAQFRTMQSVIYEILEKRDEYEHTDMFLEKDTMYILTNQMKCFGAVCMLYDHVLEQIGEILKENYYVIPSSVHEVIIVPESFCPASETLDAMIREINMTQVEAEEVLSDHGYYYERKGKRLFFDK